MSLEIDQCVCASVDLEVHGEMPRSCCQVMQDEM
jgi:hypothetical protein